MNSILWTLKTEITQNKLHVLFIFLVSVLLGMSIKLSVNASEKIESLTQHVNWDADLIVLPKGVSLNDLKEELTTAKTVSFLPEALFDTTVSLAQGAFKLSAVLAITDEKGSRVQIKSNYENIGIAWLQNQQKITPWAEQEIYSTAEWNHKVIAGFFASGPSEAMENLKNLINKKTVAQALVVKQQQLLDEKNQSEFKLGLLIYSGVLVILIGLSMLSLFFWIKIRISNTLSVYEEIGFSDKYQIKFIGFLTLLSCLIPTIIGYSTVAYFWNF